MFELAISVLIYMFIGSIFSIFCVSDNIKNNSYEKDWGHLGAVPFHVIFAYLLRCCFKWPFLIYNKDRR